VTQYSPQNQWRPFCSERCKMIDLGKWAADEYRLPEKEKSESDPDSDSVPPASSSSL
jgi:endogenous inhibitor of DNA gyrase (YacG/DUF329 family)